MTIGHVIFKFLEDYIFVRSKNKNVHWLHMDFKHICEEKRTRSLPNKLNENENANEKYFCKSNFKWHKATNWRMMSFEPPPIPQKFPL